jgi:Flp pilus assembly protein TadB
MSPLTATDISRFEFAEVETGARHSQAETVGREAGAHDIAHANRQILSGVIAVVVGGVAVMVACGYYAFIWKTAIIPALLIAALMSRRLDRFLADWRCFWRW